ncbi:DUF1254 domain-containing protein [Streptomyces sp. RB6PN25]|uniref:DUF1254 domain-containing protein n=1 Tax=Streptomyces humicola TaxID=2953240 RepID=A0ABT1PTN5_9ACTN|nr:DUF1254 domain-containing protein [Streptomyces humicola]MCQ4081032.1 DUF1254 domain-containing protein [Streptomyces humicola]
MGVPAVDIVRRTAAEAWIYAYPMLLNYRTMYRQVIEPVDGEFGRFRHDMRPVSDTPYSWAWLDLRAGPWILSVPATDRYYVLPVHDLDTCYVGLVGTRTTGAQPGSHLITGPDWSDPVPDGIDSVLCADTFLVGIVGRTFLAGPDDMTGLRTVQEGYRLTPLSERLGEPAPRSAWDGTDWPVWDEESLRSAACFRLLDFLLGFFPTLPEEAELRSALNELGVDGSGTFELDALTHEIRTAVELGVVDARQLMRTATARATDSSPWYGTRAEHRGNILARAVGAHLGLYGLPVDEAWYGGWTADSEGTAPPDGGVRDYTIRFASGALPPARFLWSVAIRQLPRRTLVDNPESRHWIGDHTPGLVQDPDGGLTLYVQRERPGKPDEAANWLPAPAGPFTLAMSIYGPEASVRDGRWSLPPLVPRPFRRESPP